MSKIHLAPPNQIKGAGLRSYQTPLGSWEKDKNVLQSKPGVIHRLQVRNKNGSAMFVHVYDGNDSSGTLLMPPIPIAATTGYVHERFSYGIPFSTGLYVSLSSTDATHTLIGSADGSFGVGYSVATDSPTSDP